MSFSFKIQHINSNSNARCGVITTPHGKIETPNFIFCATKGSIKGVSTYDLHEANVQIILSNTYHLMLRPGELDLSKFGGIRKFMGWNGPMLTDSGGFQIFSLGNGSVANEIKRQNSNGFSKNLVKIYEEGAIFRSYIDGKKIKLTPEKSMQIQRHIGADLVVVLDECTPFNVDKSYVQQSMNMSHRWAMRSLNEFNKINLDDSQRLYGIVQGGIYDDLRKQSCDFVNSQNFFGCAIGGSLGANKQQMYEIVEKTMAMLNVATRPVHLLGIGGIKDIFAGVKMGIDTFDCVHPTRIARHGSALVRAKNMPDRLIENNNSIKTPTKENINLNNSIYKHDQTPLDPDCNCKTCKLYSRAYIHYLLKAKESLSLQLISVHNIHFMMDLMESIRKAINNNTLEQEQKIWL